MDEVETAVEQFDQDQWQDIAFEVFWDIAEQHGFGYAVTAFLTTLGMTAVETETIGELMGAMHATLEVAAAEKATGRVNTTKH